VRKRHHVVSEGYLRSFADGKRILLCDKSTRQAKLVGTRDTFVIKHFNTDPGEAPAQASGASRR
jgi:hypothetical protein